LLKRQKSEERREREREFVGGGMGVQGGVKMEELVGKAGEEIGEQASVVYCCCACFKICKQ